MWLQRVVLRPGARGPAVAEVRRRLRRLGYVSAEPPSEATRTHDGAPTSPLGPGERNGTPASDDAVGAGPPSASNDALPYDEALARAVARFQEVHGLAPDGVVGPATWRRLYEPDDGFAGSGARTTPNCSARSSSFFAGANFGRRTPPGPPPASPWAPPRAPRNAETSATIRVSLKARRLTLRWPGSAPGERREPSEYTFPVSVGRASSPTPRGRYEVSELVTCPGSPMGPRWIRLTPDVCSIHGTDEPWTVGQPATPGCIRMYNKDVEFVFHRLARGAVVVIE